MVHTEVGRVGRGKEANEGYAGKSRTSGVVGGREDCGIGSHSWKNAGEGVGAREGRDDPPGVPELQKEVRAGTSLVVQPHGLQHYCGVGEDS